MPSLLVGKCAYSFLIASFLPVSNEGRMSAMNEEDESCAGSLRQKKVCGIVNSVNGSRSPIGEWRMFA